MRPNILIFMTDQQRGVTVLPDHPYKAQTPVFDLFRRQATTFTRAYCPSPHCCPSRATFFTGQFPSQHGVWNNVATANALARGPRSGIPFWSRELAVAGYNLQFSGKWHVSSRETAADFGWNVVYSRDGAPGPVQERDAIDLAIRQAEMKRLQDGSPISGAAGAERRPGEIIRPGYREYIHYGVRENPFNDEDVVDHAVDSLTQLQHSQDPWCLFVGTLGPHDPYVPPARFLDLYPELPQLPNTYPDAMADKPALYRRTRDRFDQLTELEHREALRHYLAFCSYEDYLFGRVLDTLAGTGQSDNTVVLFLSDHGDYMGEHGLWCKGLPCFDPAYHIPAAIRMPGHRAGRQVREFVSLSDFAPTFLDLAGIKYDPLSYPGASLVPFLQGLTPDTWRDALFFQSNGNEIYGIQRAIRTERWKLVHNSFDYDELYDLANDPGEVHNLLAGHGARLLSPELQLVVQELYRRLWQFNLKNGDGMLSEYIFTSLGEFGPRIAFEEAVATLQ